MSTTTKTAKVTTLADLFQQVTEPAKPKRTRKAPTKTVTTLVVEPVTITPAPVVVDSGRKLRADEQTLAEQFARWASTVGEADNATLRLVNALVNSDGAVSVRRAVAIAEQVFGGKVRGWTKDRVSALRWTVPVWVCATDRQADDVVADDAGDPLSVEAIVARVTTLANRLGKDATEAVIASVTEPSVSAYIGALTEAVEAKQAPAEAVADDEADEAEDAPEAEDDPVARVSRLLASALNTLGKAQELGVNAEAHTEKVEAIVALALSLQETLTV